MGRKPERHIQDVIKQEKRRHAKPVDGPFQDRLTPEPFMEPALLLGEEAKVLQGFKRQPLEAGLQRNSQYATIQDFTVYKFYNDHVVNNSAAKVNAPQAGRTTAVTCSSNFFCPLQAGPLPVPAGLSDTKQVQLATRASGDKPNPTTTDYRANYIDWTDVTSRQTGTKASFAPEKPNPLQSYPVELMDHRSLYGVDFQNPLPGIKPNCVAMTPLEFTQFSHDVIQTDLWRTTTLPCAYTDKLGQFKCSEFGANSPLRGRQRGQWRGGTPEPPAGEALHLPPRSASVPPPALMGVPADLQPLWSRDAGRRQPQGHPPPPPSSCTATLPPWQPRVGPPAH